MCVYLYVCIRYVRMFVCLPVCLFVCLDMIYTLVIRLSVPTWSRLSIQPFFRCQECHRAACCARGNSGWRPARKIEDRGRGSLHPKPLSHRAVCFLCNGPHKPILIMKVSILRAQGYALVADHRFPIFWSLAVLPQLPLLRRWIANEGFFVRISYYYYITSIKDTIILLL